MRHFTHICTILTHMRHSSYLWTIRTYMQYSHIYESFPTYMHDSAHICIIPHIYASFHTYMLYPHIYASFLTYMHYSHIHAYSAHTYASYIHSSDLFHHACVTLGLYRLALVSGKRALHKSLYLAYTAGSFKPAKRQDIPLCPPSFPSIPFCPLTCVSMTLHSTFTVFQLSVILVHAILHNYTFVPTYNIRRTLT